MESNSVCNHTSDNKIGRPRSGSPICLSRVLLPINHKSYNFREKKNSQVMKEREKFALKDRQRSESVHCFYGD